MTKRRCVAIWASKLVRASSEPLTLTIADMVASFSVSRKTLPLLLNGHAGISPEMAVRLSQAFGRTPEGWLQLQMHYDLAQINQRVERIQVTPFGRPETELVPAGI